MTPRETIARLIRNRFDELTNYWEESEQRELIHVAKTYGLYDEAESMLNDLR